MVGVNNRPLSFWCFGSQGTVVWGRRSESWERGGREGTGVVRQADDRMDIKREFSTSDTVWFIERNKRTLAECISAQLLGSAREEAGECKDAIPLLTLCRLYKQDGYLICKGQLLVNHVGAINLMGGKIHAILVSTEGVHN